MVNGIGPVPDLAALARPEEQPALRELGELTIPTPTTRRTPWLGALKGRLPKPERFMLACLCVFAVGVSVAIARTGGKDSPLIVWVIFLSVGLAVRFAGRALLVTVTAAVLLGMAGILEYDPDRLRDGAPTLLAVAAASFVVSSYGLAIVQSEYDQRVAARLDPLTGLLNRTGLQDRVDELRQRCLPTRQPLSLIVCDLDNFKQVNDELGHERGDAVLRDLAEIFRRRTRQFELVYRLGGDEFLFVLPGVDEQGAVRLAEDLRADVAAGRPGGTAVTSCFGVSTAVGEQIDFARLYLQADQALYRAKAQGRDRVAGAG